MLEQRAIRGLVVAPVLLAACYLSHERAEHASDDGGASRDAASGGRDAASDSPSAVRADATVDAALDAAPECHDRNLPRLIVDRTVDLCARTGDERWSMPVGDCECDSDCTTGGCGLDICFDRRQVEGGDTCECVSPGASACGCVRGRCAWYDLRNPTAACAAEAESCEDRRCCAGNVCYFGRCYAGGG